MSEAPVKAITFMKPKVLSDIADAAARSMSEIEYELTIRARRRGGMIAQYKDLDKFVTPTENGFVLFDGKEFEGVKADVRIGKKRRVIGVFGSGSDAGLIDISETVKN